VEAAGRYTFSYLYEAISVGFFNRSHWLLRRSLADIDLKVLQTLRSSHMTKSMTKELIRAADNVTRLSFEQRAQTLLRAATVILDQRARQSLSQRIANDGGLDDPALELQQMALFIERYSSADVADKLVKASGIIEASCVELGAAEMKGRRKAADFGDSD
jgi:hypothetical protein